MRERAAKAFWWMLAALVVVRLVAMLVTPLFDPSEARYAVMSANMARGGDFVVPHFTYNGIYQSFDGKPPLVFQAGGVFCKLLGVNEFAVRLFPFLCAVLLGMMVWHALKKLADEESARLGVLTYASMTAFYATAGFAMTDVPLAACVAGALLGYRCFAEGRELRYAFAVAAFLGVGMIVKGPVAFVLFGLPVFVDAIVNRRWGCVFNRKWLYALPLMLLLAVPWFVLVEQRNPGAVEYFFVNENFKRFLVHEYGDKYGAGRETFKGMAAIWAFVATLPWALVPIWSAVRRKSLKLAVGWRDFSLISVLAITGFWCLTSRTLVSYLLPVSPMFAVYLAMHAKRERLEKLAPWFAGITAVGVAAVLAVGAMISPKMRGAASAQYYGFRNRYSHEFYHGTAEECKVAKPDVMALYHKAKLAAKEEEK